MLIKPADSPNIKESIIMDAPIIMSMTDEKLKIKIKSINGNRIKSTPSPINVQPSIIFSSGSRVNFLIISGITMINEKTKIKTRISFWTN